MAIPEPQPGLVLGYAYLWRNEAERGAEEGRKHRPVVIVLAVQRHAGEIIVTVAPITHRPPDVSDDAIELPADTKRRLGLDDQRSWIIVGDLNQFVWPGVDLRPIGIDRSEYAYGLLPRGLYRAVRDKVLEIAKRGRLQITGRDLPA